jgi:hypothetical protein
MSRIEKIDCIKVNDDKSVYIRKSIEHYNDGVLISHEFIQEVVNPGDDYSQQDDAVKIICAEKHTPEVVEEFAQSIQSKQPHSSF